MIAFIAQNFVPLMFAGLLLLLLTGIPVAFGLAATGLLFGFIGMEAGLFPVNLFQALPLRVIGIMQNDTLLAIPFFTFMGIILERSGMAEDLLETVGQVFGPLRGGLAVAVVLVGALLAATTGVVAAAVISMGLISLPIMLRYGYNRTIATGTITASGTLAQAIPPSLVLIVLADQLGRSVGDMYAGAFIPGIILAGLYARFDTLRVADRTAHGAITVLTMTVGQSATPQQQKKLMAEINKFLVKGTPELAATCQTVRKIGYPDYFPRYMIKHGLSAFMAEPRNRGLVTNFEAEKAWEQVLDTYLHCPALN